ncbi:MAG: hypothetical protein IRZ16_18120 [Myxococcaceae bacterium]|nr:hypothetical protein [Myxococcaceae bacterium]
MKCIVGILAAALLVGCGVGVDDPEGLAAAGDAYAITAQGLVGDGLTGAAPGVVSDPAVGLPLQKDVPTAFSTSIGGGGGGTVSAPQDPIPAFERKQPGGSGAPDPRTTSAATTTTAAAGAQAGR